MRFQPVPVCKIPVGAGAGRADVWHASAGLDQQAGDEQFRTLVAGDGHRGVNRVCRQRRADRRQHLSFGGIDPRLGDAGSAADRLQPRGRAFLAHRRRADDRTTRGLELADRRDIERVQRGGDHAIERRVLLAPLATRQGRRRGQAHRREQGRDAHWVGRKQLTYQGDSRQAGGRHVRSRDRAADRFQARRAQHRAGQHILGLRMGRHAEPRHVDSDDTHAVDDFRQQIERHAGRGRHA